MGKNCEPLANIWENIGILTSNHWGSWREYKIRYISKTRGMEVSWVMGVPLVIFHFERWDVPWNKQSILGIPHWFHPPYDLVKNRTHERWNNQSGTSGGKLGDLFKQGKFETEVFSGEKLWERLARILGRFTSENSWCFGQWKFSIF